VAAVAVPDDVPSHRRTILGGLECRTASTAEASVAAGEARAAGEAGAATEGGLEEEEKAAA
jgi:hypothetical protein